MYFFVCLLTFISGFMAWGLFIWDSGRGWSINLLWPGNWSLAPEDPKNYITLSELHDVPSDSYGTMCWKLVENIWKLWKSIKKNIDKQWKYWKIVKSKENCEKQLITMTKKVHFFYCEKQQNLVNSGSGRAVGWNSCVRGIMLANGFPALASPLLLFP